MKAKCLMATVMLCVTAVLLAGCAEPAPALSDESQEQAVSPTVVTDLQTTTQLQVVTTVVETEVTTAKSATQGKVTKANTTKAPVTAQKTTQVTAAPKTTVQTKPPFTLTAEQQKVLDLVNQHRKEAGVAPLRYGYILKEANEIRAKEMETLYSHERPDGTQWYTALDACNVNYGTAGENLGRGYATAEEVVQGWMDSEAHKKNILAEKYVQMSVIHNGEYWVQLFATTYEDVAQMA